MWGCYFSVRGPGFRRGVGGDGYVRAGSVSKRGVGIQRIHKGTRRDFLRHCGVRKIVPCQPRAQPEDRKKELGSGVLTFSRPNSPTAHTRARRRTRPRPSLGCRCLAAAVTWQAHCPHPNTTLTGRASTMSTPRLMSAGQRTSALMCSSAAPMAMSAGNCSTPTIPSCPVRVPCVPVSGRRCPLMPRPSLSHPVCFQSPCAHRCVRGWLQDVVRGR